MTLKLIDFHGQKVTRVVHGEPYNLRVELDSADRKFDLSNPP